MGQKLQNRRFTASQADLERIARNFSARFRTERAAFLTHFQSITNEVERERLASLLLTRLMFVYFIQQKGFLDGDPHYLVHRLEMMQECHGTNSFYHYFLLPLFHQGLGRPERPPSLQALLGTIPYINGTLFVPHEVERCHREMMLPDEAFTRLFAFFDQYEWSLNEQPVRYEHEINPDVLGYIFEQYINQQQMGAYYTKEDVTRYIAQNTIIPLLFEAVAQSCPSNFGADRLIWQRLRADPDRYIYEAVRHQVRLSGETAEEYAARCAYYVALHERLSRGAITAIDDFITYNLDICQFAQDTLLSIEDPTLLSSFYHQLQQISILDPTCGSGAFLFGAISILEPLYESCLNRMQELALKEEDVWTASSTHRRYHVLKSIITKNLYGVDIMEEATEICRLRLSLKLIALVERGEDIEPLPQIEHNIRTGNALVGLTTGCDIAPDEVLARAYQIDPNDRSAFEEWRTRHQPFHWHSEFADILGRGGFDIIIGNPPYVEYNEKAFPYTLRGFETYSCGNLYPCIVERSYHILSSRGRQGMILPLAAFATKNMSLLIEKFCSWFAARWLSFYHFRPAMLFSGGKTASIPTTIYLAKKEGMEQQFSTHLIKWASEQREQLFANLVYCQITVPRDPANQHYYPKFGATIENEIMEKILKQKSVSSYLAQMPNQNSMFYRSAGGLYWKVFINFAWPYHTTSNKQCSFQEGYERDIFVALFNSSLFWWYYTVTFDTFNVKDYMLFGFRFSYPKEPEVIDLLRVYCQRLMDDFRRNAQHLKRGQTDSYTVYAKKSKAIINEIDNILAYHYGFSRKECDFIINYDLKYRMGQKG